MPRWAVYSESMKEMREPTWLTLTALAGIERLHGYGITQEVARLSNGRVRMPAGTLYAMLDRLAGEALVEPAGDQVVGGRLRRYYSLTASGRRVLAEEADRRATVSAEALRRLSLTGGIA